MVIVYIAIDIKVGHSIQCFYRSLKDWYAYVKDLEKFKAWL